MVLVFILLGIFIILFAILFLIVASTFQIQIQDLEVTNMEKAKAPNYAIIFSFYLGKKLKWLSFHLNDEKMRKVFSKVKLEKIDLKKIEKDFQWEDLKLIKKIKPKFSYFNLDLKVGLENPIMTSFLVSTIASIISIILPHVIQKYEREKYQYAVVPVYQNKNLYKMKFNCIIQVKMVHIINVIYIFIKKKGRSDLNERTTSNRRSYGYGYE